MSYDFPSMGPVELRTALNGPTGDRFLREIANAALDLAEKSHQTNEKLATAASAMQLRLEDCANDLCTEEWRHVGKFGWVIEGLKTGGKFARKGWNGKGMFIFLVPGSPELTVEEGRPIAEAGIPVGTKFSYLPHIDMWTAQGDVVSWVPSQADMLADDWEEL